MTAHPLQTTAEATDYARTGRYDETIRLSAAFAERYPRHVRPIEFGTTPEGRPMLALLVAADAATAEAAHRPVLLFQGGIHPGEPAPSGVGRAPGDVSDLPDGDRALI